MTATTIFDDKKCLKRKGEYFCYPHTDPRKFDRRRNQC